jgi:hypothetical protein
MKYRNSEMVGEAERFRESLIIGLVETVIVNHYWAGEGEEPF